MATIEDEHAGHGVTPIPRMTPTGMVEVATGMRTAAGLYTHFIKRENEPSWQFVWSVH